MYVEVFRITGQGTLSCVNVGGSGPLHSCYPCIYTFLCYYNIPLIQSRVKDKHTKNRAYRVQRFTEIRRMSTWIKNTARVQSKQKGWQISVEQRHQRQNVNSAGTASHGHHFHELLMDREIASHAEPHRSLRASETPVLLPWLYKQNFHCKQTRRKNLLCKSKQGQGQRMDLLG